MNIIVCVKQVPGTTSVEVDPVTGVLKRDGTSSKLNPYDLYALEMAFRISERVGGATVTTVSMGPNQAVSALLETLYMGADLAFLLSDRVFAGSDVQATGYALKCCIEKAGAFDLILCGKQTTDGDTAQVGPELAEALGIEHAANVLSVDDVNADGVTVTMNLDDVFQTQRMQLPCLLTIDKDACTPRLPSFRRRFATPADAVTMLTAADIDGLDVSRCGLKGSPTQVERIFPPESSVDKEQFEGGADVLAAKLHGILAARKFTGGV